MASSSSSMPFEHYCFYCNVGIAEFILGWLLKDGSYAQLCVECGSAYVNGKFCEIFHSGSDGWRDCVVCTKPLHCGCIMSCHMYAVLDFGGIGCSECLLQVERSIGSGANNRTYPTASSDSDTLAGVPDETIVESLSQGSRQVQAATPQFGENSNMDSSNGALTPNVNKVGSETPPVDASTENNIHSENLPLMITTLQDQKISGNSNSNAIPLFEKTLTASDTFLGNARVVIPKKCAEAHFPRIFETQGCPVTVQDTTGRNWKFQYCCWQNGNTNKMYVLEGLKEYMILNQWQAGNTVTFHQIPEGKLIIGTKKMSAAPPVSQEQSPLVGN